MSEKSLLQRLEEKEVDIGKMIEDNEEFVSANHGSASVNKGRDYYTEEQIRILFASVPYIFSYGWKRDKSKPNEERLNKEQGVVVQLIYEVARHPCHDMKLDSIPKIISVGQFYAGRSERQLYLEGKLRI